MSKFAENVIKFAYENRANAMIAAKQAAEGEGRLQKMMNWLNDPANKGKATAIESGLGGLAAGGLGYGLTKALGGSNKWAWANAGMAGGGTAAGIAGLKYRGEIAQALRDAVTRKLSPEELSEMVEMNGEGVDNGMDPARAGRKQKLALAKQGKLNAEGIRSLRDWHKGAAPAFRERKFNKFYAGQRQEAEQFQNEEDEIKNAAREAAMQDALNKTKAGPSPSNDTKQPFNKNRNFNGAKQQQAEAAARSKDTAYSDLVSAENTIGYYEVNPPKTDTERRELNEAKAKKAMLNAQGISF